MRMSRASVPREEGVVVAADGGSGTSPHRWVAAVLGPSTGVAKGVSTGGAVGTSNGVAMSWSGYDGGTEAGTVGPP